MTTILILGGYGLTGRALTRHLLERTNAEVLLAGRRPDVAQAHAEDFNVRYEGARVSARRVDAASAADLGRALEGVDLLVVAAPVGEHGDTVARATLAAGADYLDVQFSRSKLAALRALAPQIERAGLCFITEAGYHPGLPSVMVRYAAAALDRLDAALVACYLNMGRTLPYTEAVDELMEAFRDYQAQVFSHGRWATERKGYGVRRVDFGGEIGDRRCFSMFFEELRGLPDLYPGLRELGCYMSGSGFMVDWVVTPLVLLGLKLAPRRGVRPLGKLLWWSMQTFPKPPYLVLLKVEAEGMKAGEPVRVEAAASHPDGYELTAIPVAACLEQYLDGSARRPGLWMMGHLVEPVRLLRDMEAMGARVSRRITPMAAGGRG